MNHSIKTVVALAGARDQYQLPLALYEGDLLQALVTDMYWPADRIWFSRFVRPFLPPYLVSARFCSELDSRRVELSAAALSSSALMKVAKTLRLNRYKDRVLSRKAKRIALRHESSLFCYSYYASEAFKSGRASLKHRFLFQLHPHPVAVRNILMEEMLRVPHAKKSLMLEHEVSISDRDFEELASESHRANGWVVASSYTAKTLTERGIPADQIHVVPYGVDGSAFVQRTQPPAANQPFTVVYVGSMTQRKGLSYLLDAVRLLKSKHVRVRLCGRQNINTQFLKHYSDLNIDLKIGLPQTELVRQMHKSHVFALPSLAEGFAHVILEAMSCGLPIIATAHTCAPDVLTNEEQGFIVPIRNPEAIAEKLSWAIDNRDKLAAMGESAAQRSRLFSWAQFRAGVRAAYRKMVVSTQ